MAITKVVFYNGFHNGDLHVSREFVRQIVSRLRDKYAFAYMHNCPENVVSDLGIRKVSLGKTNKRGADFVKNKKLYINTWYGAKDCIYFKKYGLSYNCLYHMFDDVCKDRFNFSLSDISDDPFFFYPTIDFSHYNTKFIDQYLEQRVNRKKILISNGRALSGQSRNFPLHPIIERIAAKYPRVDFILTNKERNFKSKANVLLSSDIIKQNRGCDLNENAYLSTYCDAIIGRFSGAYTFALNKTNLFDRDVIFLAFFKRNRCGFRQMWLTGKMLRDATYSADVRYILDAKNNYIEKSITELCKEISK